MITNTPLRYPGGKSVMSSFFKEFITVNHMQDIVYVEPYAGGAGAALNLLFNEDVNKIIINDASVPVFSFWNSLINHSEEFMELFENTDINLNEWYQQKNIFINRNQQFSVELGFATFFLNRCNRSGILSAGPIGGNTQEKQNIATYKIDVRYNKTLLRAKLEKIINKKTQIIVKNDDALNLLKQIKTLPEHIKENYLLYLDPPYYIHGYELYLNSYTHQNHVELANFLTNMPIVKWVLSYDNVQEICDLYNQFQLYRFNLAYSVQEKKQGRELLLHSQNTRLPNSLEIKRSSKSIPLIPI